MLLLLNQQSTVRERYFEPKARGGWVLQVEGRLKIRFRVFRRRFFIYGYPSSYSMICRADIKNGQSLGGFSYIQSIRSYLARVSPFVKIRRFAG